MERYEIEYSEQMFGGIGYRCDIECIDPRGRWRHVAYTTNPEGQGLWFHDGYGNRKQVAGTCQFRVDNFAHWKRRIARTAHNVGRQICDLRSASR